MFPPPSPCNPPLPGYLLWKQTSNVGLAHFWRFGDWKSRVHIFYHFPHLFLFRSSRLIWLCRRLRLWFVPDGRRYLLLNVVTKDTCILRTSFFSLSLTLFTMFFYQLFFFFSLTFYLYSIFLPSPLRRCVCLRARLYAQKECVDVHDKMSAIKLTKVM